ncbi:MAG: ergothioneine biosynthesis protein EgtB [Balneolales bacterium]|nr:ergothioneine biosynthesis protein EgtB [Balneolales bacterium]
MKAIWKDTVIAESNKTIVVEGNHYFPPDSIKQEFFKESDTQTSCPWKGKASYKTILINGQANKDAAWYYSDPKEKAESIKNYVAFWNGVKIVELPNLAEQFKATRKYSEDLCAPLEIEDYVVQPSNNVSPPRWHLAHTTWFFEYFILKEHQRGYEEYNEQYNFLFNSYYNFKGDMVARVSRGFMTRPTVKQVYEYRTAITEKIAQLLAENPSEEILKLVEIGINHEQQHQELLAYDIKYILGTQPTFPKFENRFPSITETQSEQWIDITEGVYEIGFDKKGFCFDNEKPRHKVYLEAFSICNKLVTNGEFAAFIEDKGYKTHHLWHSEAWEYVNTHQLDAPLYWHFKNGKWHTYTFNGLQKIDPDAPVMHLSFYEAAAFAEWKGLRLPTEAEWEVASPHFKWGKLWEWTNSAYLPYPGFKKEAGALGEYNGKFMLNQMVLKGASFATPENHERPTYRNFFDASSRWIFSGVRLAKKQ